MEFDRNAAPVFKRLALSILSVFIAGAGIGAIRYAFNTSNLTLSGLITNAIGTAFICFSVWAFSVPLVVVVWKVTARSFWFWLVVGSAVGPFGVIAIEAASRFGHYLLVTHGEDSHGYHSPLAHGPFTPFAFWLLWSWIASTLASLIYLLLLRRIHRARELQLQRAQSTNA